MSRFVAALDDEIAELVAVLADDIRYRRLKELERIRAELYGAEPGHSSTRERSPAIAARFTSKPPLRRTSPERQRALDATRMLLSNRSGPVPTAEIYDHLTAIGITIGGEEPRNNLSAMLSNSGLFQANGRAGWTLQLGLPVDADEAGEDDAFESARGEQIADEQRDARGRP